ncbi:TadE/TadG family type IV pilus assembly protein [Arthrobacter cryoconiti]
MSLQGVILFPVFIVLIFGILQGAFWMHAQNLAQAAASSGYSSAKSYNAGDGAGQSAASDILANGSSSIHNTNVSISRSGTSVTVTVTGSGPSILPGWGGPGVRATVSGPIERWVNP